MQRGAAPKMPLSAKEHPAYEALAPLCAKYSAQASALWQTYVDLVYAAGWTHVDAVDVPRAAACGAGDKGGAFGSVGWAIVCGAPPSGQQRQAVVPMAVEQTLTTATLGELFARLPDGVAQTHVLLAMYSGDSTVVYYKMSEGLVKPVN
ncbi:hypothetical protein MSPP1_003594 [Malassezia sp. CBS 17886]|nr:hypothetical protein MSPP1_003594 [Malassezia sp. CBS 17886]